MKRVIRIAVVNYNRDYNIEKGETPEQVAQYELAEESSDY